MSGHKHDSSARTQNQGNTLGDRSCVRQSKLYRQYESGNDVKSILGTSHLRWDTNVKEGAYKGQKVFDHNAPPSFASIGLRQGHRQIHGRRSKIDEYEFEDPFKTNTGSSISDPYHRAHQPSCCDEVDYDRINNRNTGIRYNGNFDDTTDTTSSSSQYQHGLRNKVQQRNPKSNTRVNFEDESSTRDLQHKNNEGRHRDFSRQSYSDSTTKAPINYDNLLFNELPPLPHRQKKIFDNDATINQTNTNPEYLANRDGDNYQRQHRKPNNNHNDIAPLNKNFSNEQAHESLRHFPASMQLSIRARRSPVEQGMYDNEPLPPLPPSSFRERFANRSTRPW